jgi:hypothetical protein
MDDVYGTLASAITDGAPRMRVLTTIVFLALTAPLSSCDQQHSASDVDPRLGLECFESHRLPPGTQYEGIEKLADDGLTIRIMNGVDVVTLDCVLNPDGTLQRTGK